MTQDDLSPDALAAGLVALKDHFFFQQGKSACNSDNRVWMLGVNHDLKKMVVVRPDCGQWDCQHCAKILAKRWVIRAMLLVTQSTHPENFDFVTLTLHEKLITQEATIKVFGDAWRKLYAALKRTGVDFSYILVPELHKDNRMHVHLITDFSPPDFYHVHRKKKRNTQVKRMRHPELMDKFWKDVPRAYGFGYANDQEHIEGDTVKVAGYVAKYLAKQRKVNQWAKGFRHVRASHDVPDLPENPSVLDEFNWAMQASYEQLNAAIMGAEKQGYKLMDASTGEYLY